MPVIVTFPLEKPIFLREQSNKMYYASSYYLSKGTAELLLIILNPLINCFVIYWMIGLHRGTGYMFLFMLISFITSIAGNSAGLLMSSIFNDPVIAMEMVPVVALTLVVYGGFFINSEDMPAWNGWIQYLSPIMYSYSAWAHT